METELLDVAPAPSAAEPSVTESSPAVETSGEQQPSVTGTEAQSLSTQPLATEEVDPLEGVPTTEELQALVAQKVPHSEALARLRPAYESLKAEYAPIKESYQQWKPVMDAVSDPSLVQSAYEVTSSLYTPDSSSPSGFTSRPGLEKLEAQSPGTVDQIFTDILGMTINGPNGPTTVVEELYRSHGLNPARLEEYRNIDQLRASGIVTDAALAKIDPKYHEAFKSLTEDAREDILSLKDTNPALADQYLRNAERSLATEKWEAAQAAQQAQTQQDEQAAFEKQVASDVETGILAKVKSITDSIHQSLSSQWKPSSDDKVNNLEYAKVMSTLATLQYPAYAHVAKGALADVGVSTDGFDTLVDEWTSQYSAYVAYNAMSPESWQTRQAKSASDLAEQRVRVKLNDYALRLAQVSGSSRADQSQQTQATLAAASGRYVPSGTGLPPQGATNPYDANPYQLGTQEYLAYNKKLDREYGLNGASMFPS